MSWTDEAFETLADADAPSADLTPTQQEAEAANFLRHAGSLAMTKAADGLIDPKLVLSWLLAHLGASSVLVGLLVPIREAGALLPQLFTAARIHAMPRRKWAWAGASLGQGIAAAVIAVAGWLMQGAAAGLTVCVALAVLAVSRSVASVSYKDVLGKTIGKSRRGAATGLGASVSSAAVIAFALSLMLWPEARYGVVLAAIVLAALLWTASGLLFAGIEEDASPQSDTPPVFGQLRLLREEPQLRRFILARGFLVSTALAPPYLVLLGSQAGNAAFEALGTLVLASAAASLLSSYFWGRLSDRSSRWVLALSGFAGGAALLLSLALQAAGLTGTLWALPIVLFVLMIAYHGVRQGRSIYLVDMAPKDKRASYTAVSNTVIGLILLAAGVFGAIASAFGAAVTIGLFAGMSLAGGLVALTLNEVE